MKMLLLLCVVVIFPCNQLAQEGPAGKFLIWDTAGKNGWIDITGKIVTKPHESNIGEYSEELATITVGDKYGFVNEKGDIVIAPQWKDATRSSRISQASFHEGLAAVIDEMISVHIDDNDYYRVRCGYINKLGEYVIKPEYRQSCNEFSNGLARTQLDIDDKTRGSNTGDIGFIDHEGSWVIKPRYFVAGNFTNGFALVQSNPYPTDQYIKTGPNGWVRNNFERRSLYLIDPQGKRADRMKDCRWRYSYYEGLAYFYNGSDQPGFIDEQCRQAFLLPDGVRAADYPKFSEGLLLVYRELAGEKMYGYLDRSGNLRIPFRFTSADQFSDSLAGVEFLENGETINGYIDHQGVLRLRNTRGTAAFHNGLSMQYLHTWTISQRPNSRNIYGYMNKQGKYVWLSPRAATYLTKEWIKANYIGPDATMRRTGQ
jgi:WG containing repeat